MDPAKNHSSDSGVRREWRLRADCAVLIRQLFRESSAERWHLSFQSFHTTLTRSAAKRFGEAAPNLERIQEYFATLHVADLVLACACAEGSEGAWNEFVARYRNYLRAAAAAILRRSSSDPAAIELADSLFADLYGLSEGKAGGRSLFRYFHGRSSLKTWLRAVLSQRHVDSIRAGRRFEELAEDESGGERPVAPLGPPIQVVDPHRERYVALFTRALQSALDLLEPHEN